MPLAFSDENILDVLKDRLQLLYTQNQELTQRAQLYITLMSAALGVVGTLDIFKKPTYDDIEKFCLIILLVAFGIGAIISFWVMNDSKWRKPVNIQDYANRRDRNQQPFTDDNYFKFIFGSYKVAIEFNEKIIDRKSDRINWLTACAIVVIVASLVLIAKR